MKAIADFRSIKVLDDKYDFNWAHFYFSIPSEDGGSDFMADIEIRVPKKLTTIEEIKAYALDHSKFLLKQCIEVGAYSPHL